MAHDAFISHSHEDKAIADAACTILENTSIRCWIAPRDIPPGSEWAASIVEAIDQCRVMVLIFSSQANISHQIHREVERAVNKGIPIFPLRIEDVNPSSSMQYYLASIHWLDALTPPIEKHLYQLAVAIRSFLDINQNADNAPSPSGKIQQSALGLNKTSKNRNRLAPRWALLAAIGFLFVVGGGGAAFYLDHVDGTKVNATVPPRESKTVAPPVSVTSISPAEPKAAPPVNDAVARPGEATTITPPVNVAVAPGVEQKTVAPPPGASVAPLQLSKAVVPQNKFAFNESGIRKVADKQKIPLPPVLEATAPSTLVPVQFLDYFGAWGGEQRWNGQGRNVILIIESIDTAGNATGIYAQGPPNANTFNQGPANYTVFTAQVTSGGINFAWGPTFTFKRFPGDLMWGHVQGEHLNATITLQRIQ